MAQIATEYEDVVTDAPTDTEYEAWFRRKVEAGLKAYREGRVISNEDSKRRSLERRNRLLAAIKRTNR